MTICTYADKTSNSQSKFKFKEHTSAYCTAGFGMGTSPDRSGSCRVKSWELGDSAGALTRLRPLAVVP
jgi:hypothetical protein